MSTLRGKELSRKSVYETLREMTPGLIFAGSDEFMLKTIPDHVIEEAVDVIVAKAEKVAVAKALAKIGKWKAATIAEMRETRTGKWAGAPRLDDLVFGDFPSPSPGRPVT